jgi:hypothetical protein
MCCRKFYLPLLLLISGIVVFHIPSFPQNPSNYLRTGQNYLRNGQYVEALKSLNTAILAFPSASELYLQSTALMITWGLRWTTQSQ